MTRFPTDERSSRSAQRPKRRPSVILVIMAMLASLALVPAAASTAVAAPGGVTYLTQEDFRFGTFIIDQPGTYRLAEDISFNPNSPETLTQAIADGDLDPGIAAAIGLPLPPATVDAFQAGRPLFTQFAHGPTDPFVPGGPTDARYDPASYGLGFFAAIAIEADGVILDLNGFTLEQSAEHALLQRFFSLIELADQPFIPAQGPHAFGTAITAAKNVQIKNGVLGRSSHHAIHGNLNENIRVRNVDFDGYEVAAIALNGVDGLSVRNVTATNRKDVPILGTFSSAMFIKAYLDELVRTGATTELSVGGESFTVAEIRADLQAAVNNTHHDLIVDPNIVDGRPQIDEAAHPDEYALFANAFGLVDGNSYSFLTNHVGVAVNGFPTRPDGTTRIPSRNVTFTNVHVTDQQAFINEIVSIKQNDKPVTDPVGAVFQILNLHPDTGAPVTVSSTDDAEAVYVGNVVANAQAIVAKAFHEGAFASSHLNFGPLKITPEVLSWVEGQAGSETLADLLPAGDGYLCNGDSMFHVNKGVIGFKMDAAENVRLRFTSVDGIHNYGEAGSTRCGAYLDGVSHPQQTLPGYGGAMTRGYTFSGSSDVLLRHASVSDISADYGYAIGVDVMTDTSSAVITRVSVDGASAGMEPGPVEDPNASPHAVGVYVGADATDVRVSHTCGSAMVSPNGGYQVIDHSGDARVRHTCPS